jgi:uncharacterized protein
MRVVIAGGGGFLGKALSRRLIDDRHQVLVLTRGAAGTGRPWDASMSRVAWTPDGSVGPWASALDGADVLVNLAGDSIGEGRWTAAKKARILDSRTLATRSVVDAIAASASRPRVLVSASAQGYYGDRGDEELTEDSAPGSDFMAGVCVAWENEARKAESFARVVLVRSSLVLDRNGGALPRMLLPFKLFGGGPVGTGRQYMSWIHLADWVSLVALAVADRKIAGPLNAGTPAPVTNRDFARAVGRVLGRPSLLPAPAFALRLALGEMADGLLLGSTRMLPTRALALGFKFRFPDLEPALRDILG